MSFADARADRVRAKLQAYACRGQPGKVETRDGPFDARRIFCREAGAVVIDRFGVQTRIAYCDITDVSPVVPAAEIARLAGRGMISAQDSGTDAQIVPFPASR
ncbi:MAG: hypothetical protein ACK41X_05700 [Pseudorhodoplanes sp.]